MATIGLPSTEQAQADFFERVVEGYHSAAARVGEIVRDFRVADTDVRLRFAGDGLIPTLVPGLARPAQCLSEPGSLSGRCCEILIWDSESTGVPLTPPPRPWDDFTTRGNIWGFDSLRYRSAYQWGECSVNVMDRKENRAVYWVPSCRNLPAWVLSYPLRSILHWWMELNGRQLVHGAVVGNGNRGILIPGHGGSGKSSTALACLVHGLAFVSDDYVALTLDPEPRAFSLFSTAKLDPGSLELFPDLARCPSVKVPNFEKAVLFLQDAFGAQLQESLPVSQVLSPSISGLPETRIGPAHQLDVEKALSSGTLGYLPHVSRRTVRFLSRVARELPHATIHLGTDRARIADAIRELLAAPAPGPRIGTEEDGRPHMTVIVHFREDDHQALEAMVSSLQAQDYPRLELLLTTDAPAGTLGPTPLSILLQPHHFDDQVPGAVAANRGIRESFSELLMFLEPGDRLVPGALQDLAVAAMQEPGAAWFVPPPPGANFQGCIYPPLKGALVRKDAFRKCGLFDQNPLLEAGYQQDWLEQAEKAGLHGRQLDHETLQAASSGVRRPVAGRAALRALKEVLDQRRKQVEPA